ncbi:hypothetical protein TRFO_04628 [Tritrichomonas foetus]|uniref:VPS9 domain-containing protein n=1 Tax=Tritrichomonas foetus TaxID=1144522 RepID=A0A1J4KCX0_9EUKA|nr:hypothetical protein TRFO_04628 [Tritrichomonas foetus]|eukprot:OHT09059.1 hypothetical protein TRFO_04628 [Tritrichomonas foetus]
MADDCNSLIPTFPKDVSYDNMQEITYKDINEWLQLHDNISPYIQIIPSSSSSSRRRSIHSRMISDLVSFDATLDEYAEKINNENEIMHFSESRVFPSYVKNFAYRKYMFTQELILELKSSIISRKLYLIMDRQNDIKSLKRLLNSDLIDDAITCAISPSFFTLNFGSDDNQISYLEEFSDRLSIEIEIPKPIWLTDFHSYFMNILTKATPHLCQKLFYLPQMEYETELSVCLANLYSKEITEIVQTENEHRPDKLFNFCQNIIPNKSHLSQQEKAISLLIIFRVVYELIPNQITQTSETKYENIDKIIQLSKLPIKNFTLPATVKAEDPEQNVREFFSSHPELSKAADEISQSIFASNPIDALFCFHKALTVIDKIARSGGDGGIQAACFDDMFSLFFGAFIASDASDIFYVSKTMNQYLAKFILCPPFEYALATVEALVIHINNLDISKLT